MRASWLFTVAVVVSWVLLVPAVGRGQGAGESEASGSGARITFEAETYDFGEISPKTKSTGKFKFTNTGSALLKITKVQTTCGCTVAELSRKEYEPGEDGTLTVTYRAG
jgi:hypothetical protein